MVPLLVLIVAAAFYFVGFLLFGNTVNKEVSVEAGQGELSVSQFDSSNVASFYKVPSAEILNKPGSYKIKIKKYIFVYTSTLKVVDTTMPKGTAVSKVIWKGEELNPSDLVENIEDNTEVTVTFKNAPDLEKAGEQEAVLLLTDKGGNVLELSSMVTIKEDTEPPVITGAVNQRVYVGDTIAYRKNVSVTDNRDEEVELKIDSSNVNLSKVGDYTAVYSAVDSSGNLATKNVTVTVIEKTVSEEQVFEQADRILASITNDSMSKKEKAIAIYKWIRSNIGYRALPSSGDWLMSANEGFTKKSGDCYIYYAVSRALLTRADIDNIEILRTDKGHYWNMVNYGEGWYHFDTTPRSAGGDFCLVTDSYLEAYNAKHHSHFWDKSLYPATPLE